MIPSRRLALFMSPGEGSRFRPPDPNDPDLVPIGELGVDRRCIGRLTFAVPPLRSD